VASCQRQKRIGARAIFMNDLIFIAVMVAFFAVAAVYARFCEKI
jgi:hypothetical protein